MLTLILWYCPALSYESFYSCASIDKRKEKKKKRNININLAVLPSHNKGRI